MKIATWNINGIKARLHNLCEWLKTTDVDVVCLQEIKSIDENFPAEAIEELGFNVETHGQKSFNGVAILSKHPIIDLQRRLPGDDSDEQARYIEAVIDSGKNVARVASIYLPNGNPLGSEKFPYKISWMDRLNAHASQLLKLEEPIVLAGDYNVIPQPFDCYNHENWLDDALFQPESRQKFNQLLNIGYTDAVRATNQESELYTFWDYQAGAWNKNHGIRIDHILLSGLATDKLVSCSIDKKVRDWEKPSDHVPVIVDLQ